MRASYKLICQNIRKLVQNLKNAGYDDGIIVENIVKVNIEAQGHQEMKMLIDELMEIARLNDAQLVF